MASEDNRAPAAPERSLRERAARIIRRFAQGKGVHRTEEQAADAILALLSPAVPERERLLELAQHWEARARALGGSTDRYDMGCASVSGDCAILLRAALASPSVPREPSEEDSESAFCALCNRNIAKAEAQVAAGDYITAEEYFTKERARPSEAQQKREPDAWVLYSDKQAIRYSQHRKSLESWLRLEGGQIRPLYHALLATPPAQQAGERALRTLDEWHEDEGPALWWNLESGEPPYCGTPLDEEFPYNGWFVAWCPLPAAANAEYNDAAARRALVTEQGGAIPRPDGKHPDHALYYGATPQQGATQEGGEHG